MRSWQVTAAGERVLWAVGLALAAAGGVAAAGAHGLATRTPFDPPAPYQGRRVVALPGAADALRLWLGAGLRGRQVVVLSGQWARPRNPRKEPYTPEELERARRHGEATLLDDRSALFAAARLGVARRLDVVMPPAALTSRLGAVMGRKQLVREAGGFSLSADGLPRRFSTPQGFLPPREPVLVLVEPTWFGPGAPPDPLAWLASTGAVADLAVVALQDPAAEPGERAAALAYARSAGALFLDGPP